MMYTVKFIGSVKIDAKNREDAINKFNELIASSDTTLISINKNDEDEKVIVMNEHILDYDNMREDFVNDLSNEIRAQFESFEDYVHYRSGIIVPEHVFTPTEYCNMVIPDKMISDDITIEEFDKILTDEYNMRNYPLSETSEIIEKGLDVVIVKFNEGLRLVEI